MFSHRIALLCTMMACGTSAGEGERWSGQGPAEDAGVLDAGNARPRSDARVDASPSKPRRDASTSASGDGCSDDARWIYLVDSSDSLLRFEPDTNQLTTLGTLGCAPGARPFSMAVSRDAVAYVLHTDERIYEVSIRDVSCKPSSYVSSAGFSTFGMGFASDEKGSSSETLFVVGPTTSGMRLASLDTQTWAFDARGSVDALAELTGNANGELWGFLPTLSPLVVRTFDKNTGATLRELDVSTIAGGLSLGPAYAFAFWGGYYYMFYYDVGNLLGSSGIFRLDPETGVVETIRENIGSTIVGAGVSTCAPVDVLI